ncbi:sulfotransferase [Lutimonas saemankumensis]|uniref:sulfotransferase family protein n=1 Tax=Lutimonas saemankumensis TaxID=483016 RepID=UPI001CD32974|nr:sulfotransferase [Lutimonas saemankumensis]MCA0931591.1 sulfotransferase [Lutimonas saemankumensis]
MNEEKLIFIVSQPRAGSTYVQNLLSNNDKVNTVSEPWVMLALAPFIKTELIKSTYDYNLAMDAFLDYLNKCNFEINDEIKSFALKFYDPLVQGYEYVIDKTPRYWEILDELIELFPESKFVIVKRNPLNVAKSIIKTWEIKSLDKLNHYRRDLLMAPYKLNEFCLKHETNNNVYIVQYEELLKNPSIQVKSIYDWLGVRFKESILETSENNKFKGKYGDPYQNDRDKIDRKLSKPFKDFLSGYCDFLGESFLNSYGSYSPDNLKSTNAFNYFLELGDQFHKNHSIKKSLNLRLRRLFINY